MTNPKTGKPSKTKTGKPVSLDESWNHDVDDDDDTDNDGYVDAIKDGHTNMQADLDEEGQDITFLETEQEGTSISLDKSNHGKGDNADHTENESWLPSKEWNLGPNTKASTVLWLTLLSHQLHSIHSQGLYVYLVLHYWPFDWENVPLAM